MASSAIQTVITGHCAETQTPYYSLSVENAESSARNLAYCEQGFVTARSSMVLNDTSPLSEKKEEVFFSNATNPATAQNAPVHIKPSKEPEVVNKNNNKNSNKKEAKINKNSNSAIEVNINKNSSNSAAEIKIKNSSSCSGQPADIKNDSDKPEVDNFQYLNFWLYIQTNFDHVLIKNRSNFFSIFLA